MSRTAACTLAVGVVLFLGAGAGTAHAARLGAGGGGEGAGGALVASRSFSGVAGRPAVLGPVRIRTSRVLVADRDRDGVVTLVEAVAYFEARFGRMDADGDDALSEDEFVAGDRTGAAVPAAVLATSRRERVPGFEAFDLDGDGRVSPEEFFLARTQGAAAGAPDRRERLRRAAFAGLDADRDGVVGRAEYAAAGAGHFAERDADSDGRVTVWEFRSGPAF